MPSRSTKSAILSLCLRALSFYLKQSEQRANTHTENNQKPNNGKGYRATYVRLDHQCHPTEAQHRINEQKNWKIQNALTFTTIIVAAIVGAFALSTCFESRNQANAAIQTLKEMQDEQRPWVTGPVAVENDTLIFHNVGRDPTVGLSINVVRIVKGDDPHKTSSDVCSRLEANFSKDNKFSLIPGADWPDPFGEMPDHNSLLNLPNKTTHLAGCAVYRDRQDSLLHHTGFIFDMGVTNGITRMTRNYAEGAN